MLIFYHSITVAADLGHGKSESKMASMDLWGDQHEGGGGSPGDDTLPPPFKLTASGTFGARPFPPRPTIAPNKAPAAAPRAHSAGANKNLEDAARVSK